MTFHRVTLSSSLMNVWIRKAVILALFSSVCHATESELVYFHSKNFNNTLRWIPAEPAIPGENITYKYSVEYKTHADGAEYQKKPGCQNITVLFCDLTDETSGKPNEYYWGQVLVGNGNILGSTKTRFSPLAHTTLGKPILSTNAKASTLHVHAILPQGPNGESIGDIIARSNNWSRAIQVSYTLKITSPEWAAQEKINESGQFILELKNNAAYNICGYVFYKLTQRQGRPQSEEAKFCKEMPGDPPNYLPWLLLPAVCLLALVILSFVCTCKYVNVKKVSLPSNLIISTTPIQVLLPQNEILSNSELRVSPRKVRRDSSTVQIKPSPSLGDYSPQDLPRQICQDSSTDTATLSRTSDSEDTSAQSSVSYSTVAPPEPTEDQGGFNNLKISNKLLFPGAECGSNHGMTSVTASHTGSPLSVQDSLDSDPSSPLLLHMDSEGKLVLPFWSSQFQSSTGNLQRGPLLSDLINSTMEQPPLLNLGDTELSECGDSMITAAKQLSYICVGDSMITAATQMHDSHYTQSQTVIPNLHQGSLNSSFTDDRPESCYKQNWIPKVNSDDDRKTNYPHSWNGLKIEDGEAKEDRELERSQPSEHFLGNWQLQIQD